MCVNAIGDIYPCGYSNQKIGSIYAMGEMFKKNSDYCSFVKNRLIGVVESCNGSLLKVNVLVDAQ